MVRLVCLFYFCHGALTLNCALLLLLTFSKVHGHVQYFGLKQALHLGRLPGLGRVQSACFRRVILVRDTLALSKGYIGYQILRALLVVVYVSRVH